jgi:hypothetical protein
LKLINMIYIYRDWGKATQTPLAESRIEGHLLRQVIQRTAALEIFGLQRCEQCESGGQSLTRSAPGVVVSDQIEKGEGKRALP